MPGLIKPALPEIDTTLNLACAPGTTRWTVSSNNTPEQSNREAQIYVRTMNRAQQAYFLENNAFSTTLEPSGFGIDNLGLSHEYSVQASSNFTFQYGVSRKAGVNSYVGAATLTEINGETITMSVLCENTTPGLFRPAAPIVSGNGQPPVCAAGTVVVR